MKRKKHLKQLLSYLLVFALVFSLMPSASMITALALDDPVEPDPIREPEQDTFKYLNIFSANSGRPMSYCYYQTEKVEYYSPFVIEAEESIISFTIYASQDCSLRLYKYNGDEMNYNVDANGNPTDKTRAYYLDGYPFKFDPNKKGVLVGDVVGVQMDVNIEEGTGGKCTPMTPTATSQKKKAPLTALRAGWTLRTNTTRSTGWSRQ